MPTPYMTSLAAAVLYLPTTPESALEVECGDGSGAFFLAREFPAARVRGVDASAAAIRRAVDRIGLDPEGRIAFKRGSGRALPYPESHFDLVVQGSGRVHPKALRRVLRSDGHLILIGSLGGFLERRLRLRGLEVIRSEPTAGVPFHVGRLKPD